MQEEQSIPRRRFLQRAAAGTIAAVIGGAVYVYSRDEVSEKARHELRVDGRVRLPPGQRVIQRLREMGGLPGSQELQTYRLRVHGEVDRPLDLDFAALLQSGGVEQTCDVHCVTGWSVLGAAWTGVPLSRLADMAGVKPEARNVIFEAAHGYTANVPRDEALRPEVLLAYRLEGDPLPHTHGGPVRALVPNLYFWKSAKWLTGIRFQAEDEPGFWETRGYHNHADPWLEERYS